MAVYETELKLRVMAADEWKQILKSPVLSVWRQADTYSKEMLEARYYDTADGRLHKAGFAYRVRRENGRWIATVKGRGQAGGGLHKRLEYNLAVAAPGPDLSVFNGIDAPVCGLQQAVGAGELKTVMITRFERETVLISVGDSTIEVAADRGEIIAGGKRSPILEIELELKSGVPSALLLIGAKLAGQFFMLLEPRSKFARGLELAGIPAVVDQPEAGPVIGRVHRLLAVQAELWNNPGERRVEQLADVRALQHSIAGIAAYDGLKVQLEAWRAALEKTGTVDLKKSIPVLLNIWAVALDLGREPY